MQPVSFLAACALVGAPATAGDLYLTSDPEILRSDLDGSAPQLLTNAVGVKRIALDSVNGLLYWTSGSSIQRPDSTEAESRRWSRD